MSEAEPYLIAHKVRGEPAFDIAIKLQIGNEEGWIIPTSGHRAYPIASWKLEDLQDTSDYPCETPTMVVDKLDFSALSDHYSASPAPKGQGTIAAGSLLERLGLLRKATIRRR